jgi:5-methylcytosine-specific restriction endonuclease McrA
VPYMRNGKRDYKREVKEYTSRPEVVKKRTEQNAARRAMEKKGLVHKGDGKDVDHKKPLSKGGSNSSNNLRAVPASENRSFSRNKDGSLKNQQSKRERKKR